MPMHVCMYVYIRVNVNVNVSIIWNAGMQECNIMRTFSDVMSLTHGTQASKQASKPIDFICI